MDTDNSLEAYRKRCREHFDDEDWVDPSLVVEYDDSEEQEILQDAATTGDSFFR